MDANNRVVMDDMLPSDIAFTAFLRSLTPARVRRATRPKFRGWELAQYREAKPRRPRRKSSFQPTEQQIQIAMATIRAERKQKAS